MKITKTKRFSIALALALVLALVAAVPALADGTGFTDVAEDAWYADAAAWAIDADVTEGVGGNRFDPEGEVDRAQLVIFLWRMAGRPEPTATETFDDVEEGSWYETAVQWAVEQGITNGTGDNQFSPTVICDRAMCVTMLYRMMGATWDAADAVELVDELGEDATLEDLGNQIIKSTIEGIRESGILLDVPQKVYYELPVMWGAMNGILTEDNTGIAEEGITFRPTEPCVRAEMVSFLYQTKLLQDAANAPSLEEYGPITIAVPQEYYDLIYRNVYATGDDEDGIIITVSERASRAAAEAVGMDPDETGAGELFSIGRVSAEEAQRLRGEDLGYAEVFAKDENGKYYVFYHPTDVRYMRETNEQMAADQEQWTALSEWAWKNVREDILRYSERLTAVE